MEVMKKKVGRPKKYISIEKIDQHLDERLNAGKDPTTITLPPVESVIDQEEEEDVENNETDEENENVKGELEDLIEEVTSDVDQKKNKKIGWWNSLPKKEQFRTGDIVFDTSIGHFGIFVEPAKKGGLVKIRLFKLNSKKDIYTRDWYLEFNNIQLVKRGQRIKRGFSENENTFLIKRKQFVKSSKEVG